MINSRIITADCQNVLAPIDPRCDDEAFRIQNPGACPVHPGLIIKPSTALACSLGSIQFKAFYTIDGVEMDVTANSIWSSSDNNTALIGAISGNATGLSLGTAQISAVYGSIIAHAELTVLGTNCCDDQSVGIMLVIDTSRSMSQTFSGSYSTRLVFAKAAASRFISEINTIKDSAGIIKFNTVDDVLVSPLSDDKAGLTALIQPIAQTQQKTSFYDALSAAVVQLESSTATLKVLLLMSDGEDSVNTSYTPDNNPIALLSDFRSQGGIVICLGARASGKGFQFLSALATGGFFVNAFPGNSQAALDYLSGLKGYICAGNCTPAGDVIIGAGKLNYDAFLNWNVVDGSVDLEGNGFFDFLPGNGLYIDMAGTAPNQKGKLQLKTPIALTNGHVYGLTVWLSGNQRVNATPESVRVRMFTVDDNSIETEVLSQKVTINDYTQNFQPFSFNFTAPYDLSAYISIQQEDSPVDGDPRIGLFLDRVTLTDTTDLILLLDDNFDGENQVYVPPRCGMGSLYAYIPSQGGYGYGYGYNCYGTGCLSTPPVAQLPDPSPLPDIESGFVPPKIYTSTQTACASCLAGFVNTASSSQSVCRTATATSSVSQSAADAAAMEAALLLAQAELICIRQYVSTQTYTATCTTGSGSPVTKSSTKTSLISQEDADALALADAKAQAEAAIDCTSSNNDQQLTLGNPSQFANSPRVAQPNYPSTQFLAGLSGTINKVTVHIKKFTHNFPPACAMLLVGPTGANCILMYLLGGENNPGTDYSVSNLDIVFDDDAPTGIPPHMVSGSFKPVNGFSQTTFPSPAPPEFYGADLSVFNGTTKNGAWKLYLINTRYITGYPPPNNYRDETGSIDGWEVIIV
jgi:hypothetical protein